MVSKEEEMDENKEEEVNQADKVEINKEKEEVNKKIMN